MSVLDMDSNELLSWVLLLVDLVGETGNIVLFFCFVPSHPSVPVVSIPLCVFSMSHCLIFKPQHTFFFFFLLCFCTFKFIFLTWLKYIITSKTQMDCYFALLACDLIPQVACWTVQYVSLQLALIHLLSHQQE